VSKPERRVAKPQRQRQEARENRAQNLAAIERSTQKDRKNRDARIGAIDRPDRGPDRPDRAERPAGVERPDQADRADRPDNRGVAGAKQDRRDRREARVETAQERDRRAQRVRERERISPGRKQQIAERQERRRERAERFRENRQRRFAAVQQQRRRAVRAANIAARREYAREAREEIREYWEDRADEIRDRIRDRRDDLFDDDWWEHRHWHHGPILVSDPWWWWRPARWGSVNLFINAGWSEPVYYDYGTDVIYDRDVVYVQGEPVGTPVEYSRRVVELANPAVPAVAEAPVNEADWQPLGVWALAQEDQGDAVMFFQLSVNKEGIISGAYTNVMSGEELPVSGSVDRQTQRAAWHIGDAKDKVFEAGMGNLTQDQASCLVHVGNGETQNWLLVRMTDPNLPDKPATLGQVTQ
jgi:hypothetical protein